MTIAGFDVRQVSAAHVRNFARSLGNLAKTDLLGEKQVAALAGLTPINSDSRKRRIKGGRTWLRHLLYQAALVASNHNPTLAAFAKRLKQKGKPHKLVIIAVARKRIITANALLTKNVLWNNR
ncbi:hypothetical protein MNBD_ALPHA04-2176 [hydrothermal vent metagenome]|uniref:Transposase IS116/IS110/IS902 C-terminal domain-containing protein n=2 Tax=hydrothermal vent metagenome TaxID=652676 RepID=A0A3B0SHP6_9ZZZZ